MPTTAESPQLNILHVLTLNGGNGEYGGPVRVARELCQELNSRGHKTHIFSGAVLGSEPVPSIEVSESFVYVKPITQKLRVSSLWSWRLIPPLKKLISNSDIIHIHFAREMVPLFAAFLSIILRKPFVTQTHGMIISDGRLSTRVLDSLLTRPLINRSKVNLVLSDYELYDVKKLRIKPPLSILPNGIAQSLESVKSYNATKRIIFCSRLDKRKGVDKFIKLAEQFKESGLSFEIYGPDGGELEFVKSEINNKNISNSLKYKGSLPSSEVQSMLQNADLLILPSKDEPFPMVILESLAVGTQVLVMPSCGFASQLRDFESAFVAESEDQNGLLNSFQKFFDLGFDLKSREAIRAFCRETFGISSVADQLVQNYKKALFNE